MFSNGASSIVRGLGLIQSVSDVESIAVSAKGGVPIYVKDVAKVQIGNAFRGASLVKNGQDAVGGVVVARSGVNTKEMSLQIKVFNQSVGSFLGGDSSNLIPLQNLPVSGQRNLSTLNSRVAINWSITSFTACFVSLLAVHFFRNHASREFGFGWFAKLLSVCP